MNFIETGEFLGITFPYRLPELLLASDVEVGSSIISLFMIYHF